MAQAPRDLRVIAPKVDLTKLLAKIKQKYIDKEAELVHIARDMAKNLSHDPRTKVGCVIVNHKGEVVSAGVNALPVGVVMSQAQLIADRALKNKLMLHAEANAVNNSPVSVAGMTAVVTHHPCDRCASILAAAGILRVIVPDDPPNEGWELDQYHAARIMSQQGMNISRMVI